MPVINMTKAIEIASKRHLIIPAYNSTNMEMTLGIMDAFEQAGMPGIIQIAPTNIGLTGYELMAESTKAAASRYTSPFVLHLDHGKTLDDIRQAVQAGFTSVMIDGASLPFEENIDLTCRAVDYAHLYGVTVEAELGAIAGKEDDHVRESEQRTNPDQVREFVERTQCDLLAVSIGNVHGLHDRPNIDIDCLKKISAVSPVPLVLHGGSGISAHLLQEMGKHGILKINIASELRQAFIGAVAARYNQDPTEADLVSVLSDARKAVTEVAYRKAIEINQAA